MSNYIVFKPVITKPNDSTFISRWKYHENISEDKEHPGFYRYRLTGIPEKACENIAGLFPGITFFGFYCYGSSEWNVYEDGWNDYFQNIIFNSDGVRFLGGRYIVPSDGCHKVIIHPDCTIVGVIRYTKKSRKLETNRELNIGHLRVCDTIYTTNIELTDHECNDHRDREQCKYDSNHSEQEPLPF